MAKLKKAPEPLVTTSGLIDPLDEVRRAAGGRPKGAKTVDRPEAILRPARCPSCRSTRREAFRDGPLQEMHQVMEVGGETYNHQLWRNTKCLDCGQNYRVIEYRFEPEAQ